MSAVSVFSAVAPTSAGRVIPRGASSSRSSVFVGFESKHVIKSRVCFRGKGTVVAVAASRAEFSDPRESPIVRANNGISPAREPVAVNKVAASLTRLVEVLWRSRKGFAAIAFALALALVDPGAAVAGRGGGRSGGRMGGSSFRSTSRSTGQGLGGMGGMGGGLGAAGARTGAAGASGAGAGAAPRMGMGMPSLFFMPSFGYGYGMGGGYMLMKVLVQVVMMYMIYTYFFGGPRGGRGNGKGNGDDSAAGAQ
jgi:hypothetical protein|tara:strand:- start:1965 stop:2720 length:756 start_codon:yes stop_codon:yes gene_type:complete